MDINNKQELIAELEKYHLATKRTAELDHFIKDGAYDEARVKIKERQAEYGTLAKIPAIFDLSIEFFEFDSDALTEKKEKFKNIEKIFYIVLAVTGVTLLVYFLSHWNFLNCLSTLGIFASIFMGVKFSSEKGQIKKLEDEYNSKLQKYNESLTKFNNALQVYEKEKQAGIEAAREYGKKYREFYVEADGILTAYCEKAVYASQERDELLEYMETFDLVDESYQHLIPKIVANLKSSRADTLKEALNIAIDEERQEQYEAQRRYEEEQRAIREQLRLEAEQAEIRRHNMEMERQAAVQAKAAEDAARMASDAARRQAAAEKQAMGDSMRAQSAANMRCARCANHDACGNSRGVINCGAFRPKTY